MGSLLTIYKGGWMKYRWLSLVGIVLLVLAVVIALTCFATPYNAFQLPFLVLGLIGGFVVIGLGEILYTINKKGDQ